MTGSELGAPTGMRTMSALLILGLASMPAILAHGPVAGKCACEAGEADHPFTISCADKTTIATAATTLTACTKTKAACAAETNGLMICQQAFFILQAHHSFCGHETLTTAQAKLVHDYEDYCKACEIFRPYDATLPDCIKPDCHDNSTAILGHTYLTSSCTTLACCDTQAKKGAFRSLLAYHDLCDEDDIPADAEKALHDYEEPCEESFCNVVTAAYNGKVCPPAPTTAPTAATVTLAPVAAPCTNSPTAKATVDDHDDHGEGHLVLDIIMGITIVVLAVLLGITCNKNKSAAGSDE